MRAGRSSACSTPAAASSNRDVGRPAGGAEPVQPQQRLPDHARAADQPAGARGLKTYVENDARLKLDAKSEVEYFAEQASQTTDLIQKLGWPLAIAMAFGALAGALNTLYSSVTARAAEIATLRAIGFGGCPLSSAR